MPTVFEFIEEYEMFNSEERTPVLELLEQIVCLIWQESEDFKVQKVN